MSDTVSKEQRSLNMSRIRNRDTKPEIIVRSLLHKLGFRFRKNVSQLPGKPDIVLPKHRTIVFVHGCFWHQHKGCSKSHRPKSNLDYWNTKLDRTIQRDRCNIRKAVSEGWRIITIWECELKNISKLEKKIMKTFRFVK